MQLNPFSNQLLIKLHYSKADGKLLFKATSEHIQPLNAAVGTNRAVCYEWKLKAGVLIEMHETLSYLM